MSDDEPSADLSGLFEDLEQQARGLHLAERDAELADRARGEYAAVTFASRVHASLGRHVTLTLRGGEVVVGTLTRAGADWCAVTRSTPSRSWLVRLDAVAGVQGLSARAVPEPARPAVARLTFGSALHRLASGAPDLLVHVETAEALRVRVSRIGADFVEVEPTGGGGPSAATLVVPFGGIVAVRAG